jgi:hypothetical protein
MLRNIAEQKWRVYAWDVTTGLAKTGDAANISAYITVDDGVAAATNDAAPTEASSTNEPGYYDFDLTQAETNGAKLSLSPKSVTANIQVVACPPVVYTVAQYSSVFALNSSGHVTPADDSITAAKFDESTAFPLASADTGSTAVARTGADGDTLETLSDQLDDVPTVAEFEARTLPSADYFDPSADSVDVTTIEGTSATSQLAGSAATGASVALAAYDPPTKAEMDAGFAALPTATAIVDEWETQSQADPTGFQVNVAEISGSAAAADNAEVVFDTDFASNYNATVDAWNVSLLYWKGDSMANAVNGSAPAHVYTMADDVITAAKIAAGAIDAATFAADVDAEVRSWLGLAAADLDTQLEAIVADTDELQQEWADGGRLDLIVDAIAGDVAGLDGEAMRGTDGAYTGTPPSASAVSAQVASDLATAHGAGSWATATGFAVAGDAMTLTSGERASVASAVLAAGNIDGYTLEEAMKLGLAVLAGVLSGAGTTTIVIKAADGSKTRVTATVDSSGNRSALTLDAAD